MFTYVFSKSSNKRKAPNGELVKKTKKLLTRSLSMCVCVCILAINKKKPLPPRLDEEKKNENI